MSLIITQNKKDISIHQALWYLQDFDFMDFSDKFKRVDISPIVEASEIHDYKPEDEEFNENNKDQYTGQFDMNEDLGVEINNNGDTSFYLKNEPIMYEMKNQFKQYINRNKVDLNLKIGPYKLRNCTFFQYVEYHNNGKELSLPVKLTQNIFNEN